MAKLKKKAVADWEQALRRSLKAVNGKGWSLRESRGRAQLVQILEDRSRRSTKLEIIWASKNVGQLLEAVAQLREYLQNGMDWEDALANREKLLCPQHRHHQGHQEGELEGCLRSILQVSRQPALQHPQRFADPVAAYSRGHGQ